MIKLLRKIADWLEKIQCNICFKWSKFCI